MFLPKELGDDLGHLFEREHVGTGNLISPWGYVAGSDESRDDVLDCNGLYPMLEPRG